MADTIDSWTTYGAAENRVTEALAMRAMEIMSLTSVVHRDRDFAYVDLAGIAAKINENRQASNLPSRSYNWMKLTIGRTASGDIMVAMFYHLLRHRVVAADADVTYGCWSTSVGIHPALLPMPSGTDPFNSTHPYFALAKQLCTRMNKDLRSFSPSGEYSVIYDDIDRFENAGAQPGNNLNSRRKTRIGEFGCLCQYSNEINGTIFEIPDGASNPSRQDTPKDQFDQKIRGWSRNGADAQLVVTRIRAKPIG